MTRETTFDLVKVSLGLLLVCVCCSGISLRHPLNVREYVEARACAKAQEWVTSTGHNVYGISCDVANVHYADYDLVPCSLDPEAEPSSLGCFEFEKHENKNGEVFFTYDITIATRRWGWENTLIHEYCHFLLLYAGYGDWVEACHTPANE